MNVSTSIRVKHGLKGMSKDSIIPYVHDKDCRECGDKEHSKFNPGFYYVSDGKALKECSCHKRWKRTAELKLKARNSNIWIRDSAMIYNPDTDYIGKQSILEVEKLKLVVKNFDMYSSNTIYIYGRNGSQKTTLSQWLGLSLIKKGKSVAHMTMKALVDIISPNFEDPQGTKKKLEYLLNLDVLILDEVFDKSKMVLYSTGSQIGFLTDFLKERIENGRFNLLISNIHPNGIKELFGESLHSLIYRNTVQMGTLLEFKDVYDIQRNVFQVTDTFK